MNEIPEIKYDDIYKYSLDYVIPDINKIDYWIKFFHISSSGFCYYQVNNGMIGIMWKKDEEDENYEGDKFLLNQKDEVFYKIIEDNDTDKIKIYKTNEYPNNLKERMETFFKYNNKIKQKIFEYENQENTFTSENHTLISKAENNESFSKSESKDNSIIHQKIINRDETSLDNSMLSERNNYTLTNDSISTENKETIIYIKSFLNDKNGKFLVLSDGTKQIIFKDKINILISDKKETVGYIDKQKKVSFISLMNAMQNSSKDLVSRLKYIKKVNYREIKDKMKKKFDERKNQYQNIENSGKEEESKDEQTIYD